MSVFSRPRGDGSARVRDLANRLARKIEEPGLCLVAAPMIFLHTFQQQRVNPSKESKQVAPGCRVVRHMMLRHNAFLRGLAAKASSRPCRLTVVEPPRIFYSSCLCPLSLLRFRRPSCAARLGQVESFVPGVVRDTELLRIFDAS